MRLVHRRARAIIEQRGLRYDRVAEKVGVTPDRFGHILEGRRPVPAPEDEFYARLADALFCDPAEVQEPEEDLAPA